MTVQTCERLAKHFESINDKEQAAFYRQRAQSKGGKPVSSTKKS